MTLIHANKSKLHENHRPVLRTVRCKKYGDKGKFLMMYWHAWRFLHGQRKYLLPLFIIFPSYTPPPTATITFYRRQGCLFLMFDISPCSVCLKGWMHQRNVSLSSIHHSHTLAMEINTMPLEHYRHRHKYAHRAAFQSRRIWMISLFCLIIFIEMQDSHIMCQNSDASCPPSFHLLLVCYAVCCCM